MNKTYSELLLTQEWRMKRQEILQRDACACVNCGSRNDLHVHHTQYHACKISGDLKKPWQYHNRFLVTLCQKCHKAGHKQYSIPTFSI